MDASLFFGEFTKVRVIDPADPAPPMVGNLVIDPSKKFLIEIEWKLSGFFVPVYLEALGGNWEVEAYASSLGPPGDNLRIASKSVPVGVAEQPKTYSVTLEVPANTLKEHTPGPQGPSGIYRLGISAFLDSTLGSPGYDIAGFADGPTIKAEVPE
jgi:hypothetical protein